MFAVRLSKYLWTHACCSQLSTQTDIHRTLPRGAPIPRVGRLGQRYLLIHDKFLFKHFFGGSAGDNFSQFFVDGLRHLMAIVAFDSPNRFFYTSIRENLKLNLFDRTSTASGSFPIGTSPCREPVGRFQLQRKERES